MSEDKPEIAMPSKFCVIYQLGQVAYETALSLQRAVLAERRQQASEDLLILLEHPPVYTLGQGSSLEFVNFHPGEGMPDLVRTERGGEVTYHCPGQLVGYPLLNLRNYKTDLHWYLRQLEETLIQTLAHFNLEGYRIPGATGIWLEGCKVAAIGIKVSRWFTMHGFALNVCPDLSGFQHIVPCGIADRPVGSLQQFRYDITVEQVRPIIARSFSQVFQVDLQVGDVCKLNLESLLLNL